MRVKDLIEELKKLDGELLVVVSYCGQWDSGIEVMASKAKNTAPFLYELSREEGEEVVFIDGGCRR